jgi:hypothetical protein
LLFLKKEPSLPLLRSPSTSRPPPPLSAPDLPTIIGNTTITVSCFLIEIQNERRQQHIIPPSVGHHSPYYFCTTHIIFSALPDITIVINIIFITTSVNFHTQQQLILTGTMFTESSLLYAAVANEPQYYACSTCM